MIPNLHPTSKASLKQMCLIAANGDLDKAQKIYDYMIKDMEDLPLFDVVPPSRMEQIKSGVSDAMQWLSQNQDQILVWADVIGGFFKKNKGGGGAAGGAAAAVNPLPDINQS